MPNVEIAALAVIQGVTEFLPISSSAHAALFSYTIGSGKHSVLLDTALHAGSLLALLVYFYKEWLALIIGARDLGRGKADTQSAKTLLRIILATLPLLLLGGIIAKADALEALPRAPALIAITSIGCALLLWAADAKQQNATNAKQKRVEDISLLLILGVGIGQCLALMPGVSRAGVVITIALFSGLARKQAARLALLTALPALAGATALGAQAMLATDNNYQQAEILQQSILAATISFLVSMLALLLFMRSITKIGMLPFVIYRIALGATVLLFIASDA